MKSRLLFFSLVLLFGSTLLSAQNLIRYDTTKLNQPLQLVSDQASNVFSVGVFYGEVAISDEITLQTPEEGLALIKYSPEGEAEWAIQGRMFHLMSQIDLALDSNGYVYVLFQIQGWGEVNGEAIGFEGKNGLSTWLMKVGNGGAFEWIRRVGDHGTISGRLAVDRIGNIYIGGRMQDSVTIGGVDYVEGAEAFRILLAKYDASGNPLWSRTSDSVCWGEIQVLGVDSKGVCHVAGEYNARMFLGDSVLTAMGSSPDPEFASDLFVAGYTPDGDVLYVRNFRARATHNPVSLVVDDEDRLLMTGVVSGDTSFFDDVVVSGTYSRGTNTFVARLTDRGVPEKVVRFGYDDRGKEHPTSSSGIDVLALPGGEVVLAGQFNKLLMLGEDTIVSKSGRGNGFLLFLDEDLELKSYRVLSSEGGVWGSFLTRKSSGNVLASGWSIGELYLDERELFDLPDVGASYFLLEFGIEDGSISGVDEDAVGSTDVRSIMLTGDAVLSPEVLGIDRGEEGVVELCDAMGRTMAAVDISASRLALQGLPAGTYFVRILSDGILSSTVRLVLVR